MEQKNNASILNTVALFAQPYDITANGFYFQDYESYQEEFDNLRNEFGQKVEEFEIQFIDGEIINCDLFNALSIHQGDIENFFDACENWSEDEKIKVIIAVGECGYDFNLENDNPDQFDMELYECDSLKDLAEQFIEEGIYGEIPENIRYYLDIELMARDLEMDYSEIEIDGTNYVYRCG